MAMLTAEVRNALEGAHLAHLVTLNSDGSPHVTIVWVGLDGNEVISGHLGSRKKLRNVERDPRVALSMETGGKNQLGLDQYLVLNGTARVTEGGAVALLQQLALTYIGSGVKFPPMEDPPSGFVLRITPTSVGGVGPWAEGA